MNLERPFRVNCICNEQAELVLPEVLKDLEKQTIQIKMTLISEGQERNAYRFLPCATVPSFLEIARPQDVETDSRHVVFPGMTNRDATVNFDFTLIDRIPSNDGDSVQVECGPICSCLTNMQQLYLQSWVKSLSRLDYFLMLAVAEEFTYEPLLEDIYASLAEEFCQISKLPMLRELKAYQLKRILCHPNRSKCSVDSVVDGILKWLKSSTDEHQESIAQELLRVLDLAELSVAKLRTLVNTPFIQKNSHIHGFFEKVLTSKTQPVGDSEAKVISIGCNVERKCNTMAIYNIIKKTWSPITFLPLYLGSHVAIAVHNKCLYLIGGSHDLTAVYKCKLQRHIRFTRLVDLKSPVAKAGAATYMDNIFIIGGVNDKRKRSQAVQRLNTQDGTAVIMSPTVYTHTSPLVFSYRDNLYVIGSKDDSEAHLEQYSQSEDTWTEITNVPTSVFRCRACLVDDRLLVAPWRRMQDLGAGEHQFLIYDFSRRMWSEKMVACRSRAHIHSLQAIRNTTEGKMDVFMLQRDLSIHAFDLTADTMIFASRNQHHKDMGHFTCCLDL